MAIIGSNQDALFHGLSDFWKKMFVETPDLRALYEGTEYLLGDAYLNLLSDVLNSSVLDAPLFNKENYRSIVLRDADIVRTAKGWEHSAPVAFARLPLLQNKIFAPTATLEENFDYTVEGDKIIFKQNPFAPPSGSYLEGVLTKFASRTVDTVREISFWAVDPRVDHYDLYYRFGHFFSSKKLSTEMYRMFIRGVMQLYLLGPAVQRLESALNVAAGLPVVRDDGEFGLRIETGVDGSGEANVFNYTVTILSTSGMTFGPASVGGYLTLSDAQETGNLGTYRITAVADDQIHLTVELLSGAPWSGFIPDTSIDWEYSTTGTQTVVTDANRYVFPRRVALRPESEIVGKMLRAFEPLTQTIAVTDYVSDPEWWYYMTIPHNLLPQLPTRNRIASPIPVVNKIWSENNALLANATGYSKIGELGFKIGPSADISWDSGLNKYLKANLQEATPHEITGKRKRAAFMIVDRFLKMHLFGVTIDQTIEVNGLLITDVLKLLADAKPTHTMFYFKTALTTTTGSEHALRENLYVNDAGGDASVVCARANCTSQKYFHVHARLTKEDVLDVTDNAWKIGSAKIGLGYDYDVNFVRTTSLHGRIGMVIGGIGPTITAGAQSLTDEPLNLTVRTV